MGDPTQGTYTARPQSTASTTGVIGDQIDTDNDLYTLQGGASTAQHAAAAAYAAGTTYAVGAVVTAGGKTYVSRVAGNIGNTPASSPTQWRNITDRRGPGEPTDATTRRKQYHR